MTLAAILSDEALRQREFPVSREKVFLAHAGVCPLPGRVMQVVSDYAQQASLGDQESIVFPALLEDGRKAASNLLRCQPEEVTGAILSNGLKVR